MKKYFLASVLLSSTLLAETWILRDGSTVVGEKLSETKEAVKVHTTFGDVTIQKSDVVPQKITIELHDGSILNGDLLEDAETFFRVHSPLGDLKIEKSTIQRFEKSTSPSSQAEAPAKTYSQFWPFPIDSDKKERIDSAYRNTIEPLIDVFFDPTGYLLKRNELYLSGLSIAYGLSDQFLAAFNLFEFAGINSGSSFNPNIELKAQVFQSSEGDRGHATSVGVKLAASALNGMTRVTCIQTNTLAADPTKAKEYGAPVCDGKEDYRRPWADKNDSYESPRTEDGKEIFTNYKYESETGWRSQFYLTHTVSSALKRGGGFNYHIGGQLEANSITPKIHWFKRPSYRVFTGFDLDASRKLKILGEVFYDPDYWNWITSAPNVGVDFGLMFAFSDSFRFMLHIQPYIVGFYWRF